MMPFFIPSESKAMAWADRLYAPIRNRSTESASRQAGEAFLAYRAVLRKYPGERRAHVGAARCLFRRGLYADSVAEYLAGKGPIAELASARDYARLASLVSRDLPAGRRVCHLARLGGDRWVALTARPTADESYREVFTEGRLRTYRTIGSGLMAEGPPLKIDKDWDTCYQLGIFAPPSIRPSFLVQATFGSASNSPNEALIIDAPAPMLRIAKRLRSIQDTSAWVGRGRLCVLVEPTYKLYWPDVYEWAAGRLTLANRRWPEVYRPIARRPMEDERLEYGFWMWNAARLTVLRRSGPALAAWRQAERCALASFREGRRGIPGYERRYRDYGFQGDAETNLREIRQRIAWLRREDWDHDSLYRPYNLDLQAAPLDPSEGRAHLGEARRLFRTGRYAASVAEYRQASGPKLEMASAIAFAQAASRIGREVGREQSVLHLVRLGRKRWAAVTGLRSSGETPLPSFYGEIRVGLYRIEGPRVVPEGRAISLDQESTGVTTDVEVFAPVALRPAFVVRSSSGLRSDIPSAIHVVRAAKGGPKLVGTLQGSYGTRVWMKGDRLCAAVNPVYKVIWSDVYEWTRGGFRLANPRHRDFYTSAVTVPRGGDYGEWANYASTLTIQRRRPEAIRAWREALRCGIGSRKGGRFSYFGNYGDLDVNLRQIRQRIAWLQRGDWDHWLLYRPLPSDVQDARLKK